MTAPSERPTPLFGERALHLPRANALVVGDVHVGLEGEARKAGLRVPSQSWRMRERLERLVRETGAERLIVIGDLKHAIPVSTREEEMDLPGFFEGLSVRVDLVRGNHDVDLEDLVPEVEVHEAPGIVVGDVGLLHGHTWPAPEVMACRTVVTCHNHPAVLLVDELGHRHKEPAWVRAGFTPSARERYPDLPEDARLLVLPAFNELVGGAAFNGEEGRRLLGPLFGNGLVDVDAARLYTLDGIDLGTVAALRAFGSVESRGARKRAKGKPRSGWTA